MSKTKGLTITIVLLIILNVVMLFLFMKSTPEQTQHEDRPGAKHRPKQIVVDRLGFNETQVQAYDELIQTNKSSINKKDTEIKALKAELFALLGQEDRARKDLLLDSIVSKIRGIEGAKFHHFEDIEALCTPEQMTDFKALSSDLARIFAPRHKK